MTSTTPHLGLAAYYDEALVENAPGLAEVAKLLVDPRWPWVPALGRVSVRNPHELRTAERKRIEREARFRVRPGDYETVQEALANPAFFSVRMELAATDAKNHADSYVENGTFRASWMEVPFRAEARIRGFELPEGKTVQAWVEVMHELVTALRTKHAILGVFDNPDATMSDVAMMGISVNGRSRHPHRDQVSRAAIAMGDIGGKYVRHPRWGTYLLPRHLDAVGGLARVRAEVEPHEVREIGELVYVQLTAFEDALTEACEAKRRALEAILEPILVPKRG